MDKECGHSHPNVCSYYSGNECVYKEDCEFQRESELSRLRDLVKELREASYAMTKWCDKNDWGAVPKRIESELRESIAKADAVLNGSDHE